MIRDEGFLRDVRKQWEGVQRLANWSRVWATTEGHIVETGPSELFNLPLILAYCCLEDVLTVMIREGQFDCPHHFLDKKMAAARDAGLFVDFKAIEAGRLARNQVAHEAILHDKKTCLAHIRNVGAQLRSWRLIPASPTPDRLV